MDHPILEIWNNKGHWFRDRAQGGRVATVLLDRLADDREQEECRYLSRLRWHFFMGYQEVSYAELQTHVSEPKLTILNDLFYAIADHNYDAIDEWAARCEDTLPVIQDRWRTVYGSSSEDDDISH